MLMTPSTTTTTTMHSLLLLALVLLAGSARAQDVYVPGNADEVPGAQLIPIGTGFGIDGLPTTTYQIGDAIVAQATGTVNVQQGASSIGCALGADGYATCSGLVGGLQPFAYTEPITYFGQTTGLAAPMPAPTGSPLDGNGRQTMGANLESGYTPTANLYSGTLSADVHVSIENAGAKTTNYPEGPRPDQAQATSANPFYVGVGNGASSTSASKMITALAACAVAAVLPLLVTL